MTLGAEIKPQGRSQGRIHSFDHYSLCQALAGLVTPKQRRQVPAPRPQEVECNMGWVSEGPAEVRNVRFQKRVTWIPLGSQGGSSKCPPRWASREEK